MSPDFFRRVDEIFNAARVLPSNARIALLDRECASDPQLRAEVDGLLAHDDAPEDYFRTPALGAALQMITAGGSRRSVAQPVPERIGRYRIIRTIGEGGFGVVYLAEQENPRRTVAVKVVKAHLATPSMLRRFEYEAQLLGRLQHPGIAQIHEAGVVESREMGIGKLAFFAMEYVEGTPLDVFMRNRQLPLADKLELLAKVCDAVQYAHQRGVIHRDLKPGNILVSDEATERRSDEGGKRGDDANGAGEGGADECQDVSGSDRLAKVHGAGEGGLSRNRHDAGCGAVWNDESDAAGCGVGPVQHRRRARPREPERLRALPEDRPRLADGASNADHSGARSGLSEDRPRTGKSSERDRSRSSGADTRPGAHSTLARLLDGAARLLGPKTLSPDLTTASSAPSVAPSLRRSVASPKILDFGVARSTDGDQQLTTMGTSVGQLVGTLPYMSPEQVIGNPDEVDTRSDVYSLGVITYQVLAGQLPLDFRSCAVPEAARRIREEQPRRLGTIDRAYRGEIEIIVAKALEKDRARRYQSASDLAADLRRFIAGEPIEARRDSALYVLRKTMHRYRGAVYAGMLIFTLVVIFAVYASMQAKSNADLADREFASRQSAEQALAQTVESRRAAENARQNAEDKLCVSNIERGRLLGVTESMGAAEALLWHEFFKNPASRHAYWALWELYSRQPALLHIRAHAGQIGRIRVAPSGAFALTSGIDGFIRKWDLQTATLLAEEAVAPRNVVGLDLNLDGTRAAFFVPTGHVVFWDVVNWREVLRVPAHAQKGAALDFSPDGALLASCGGDDELQIWDAATGAPLARICTLQNGGSNLRFTPDGRQIVTTGLNGSACIWNVRRPAGGVDLEWNRTLLGHRGPAGALAISPDGLQLATGGRDRTIRIWDMYTGQCLKTFTPSNGSIRTLLYSPDGGTLFAGGWWSVDLLSTRTFIRERDLAIPTGIFDLALDNVGRLYTVADDTLRVWETISNGAFRSFRRADERGLGMDVSADGKLLYAVATDNLIHVRDAATLQEHDSFDVPGSPLNIRISPDGRRAVVVTRTSEMHLVDLENRATISSYPKSSSPGCAVAFHPRGRIVAMGGSDGAIHIRDPEDGHLIHTIPSMSPEVIALHFSPDGTVLASIAREPRVRLRDSETWAEIAKLPAYGDQQPWCLDFSPDGNLLAVGGWHKAVEMWDWKRPRRLALLEGHTQLINSLQFSNSPTDPMLVTGSNDGTVKLWDPQLEVCLATLDAHAADCLSAVFLPPLAGHRHGNRVAAGYNEAGLGVWDLGYYDRHIAGNAGMQVELLSRKFGDAFDAPAAKNIADILMSHHWRSASHD